MQLTKIGLEDFGKFHQTTISCGKGLNLFTGANESGKTSVRRFCRAMLYGLERERGLRAKNDDYTIYQPWNYGKYQGTIEFMIEGEKYRLFRSFLSTQKELVLTNLSKGVEIEKPQEFLRLHGLINEQAFLSTLCVGNLCATEAELADELHNYLANLALTGGAGLDLTLAQEKLSRKKRELNRLLEEQEIQSLQKKLQKREEIKEKRGILLQKKQEWEQKKELIEIRQKITRQEQERLMTIQQKQQELLDYLREGNPVEEQLLSDWLLEQEEEQRRVTFYRKKAKQQLFLVAPGILILLLMLLPQLRSLALGMVGGLSILTGLAGSYLMTIRARRLQRELSSKKETVESKLTEFFQKQRYLAFAEEQSLLEQLKLSLSEGERIRYEQEQMEEQEAELDQIEEQLRNKLQKNLEIKKEMEAIELTGRMIAELSAELYRSFGERFNQALSSYAAVFTDGIYQCLSADEQLQLKAVTAKRNVTVPQVSYGTGEQFYLALRMAAADVFDPKKQLPLFFDDTFANFDKNRLESALVWLSRCGRQVFLFSSNEREEQIAKRMGIAYEEHNQNLFQGSVDTD